MPLFELGREGNSSVCELAEKTSPAKKSVLIVFIGKIDFLWANVRILVEECKYHLVKKKTIQAYQYLFNYRELRSSII
jgi:hypothetical protein